MAANPRGSRVDSPREPPTTPRKVHVDPAAINDLVRELRDQYGLAIAPRDTTYSPAHCKDLPGDALYSRIQLLFWKDRSSLEDAIEHCKRDIRNDLSGASAQQRTEFVFQELHDPAWIRTNRIPTPLSRTPFVPTASPSPSKLEHGQSRGIDSNVDIDADSMPPSPLASKSVLNTTNSLSSSVTTGSRESSRYGNSSSSRPTTAATSFSDGYIDLTGEEAAEQSRGVEADFNELGSSPWPTTQEMPPYPGPHRKIHDSHPHQSIPPQNISAEALPPSKRKRSDKHEDSAYTSTKHQKQELKSPPKETVDKLEAAQSDHFMLRNLVDSGFGSRYSHDVQKGVPYAVSVELARLLQDTKIDPDRVRSARSHEDVRRLLKRCNDSTFQQSPSTIWGQDNPDVNDTRQTNFVISADLAFNPPQADAEPFSLRLNPVRAEKATSTRIERHFDPELKSCLLLKVAAPSIIRDLPAYASGLSKETFKKRYYKWLRTPKTFLGRTWFIFRIEDVEKKRGDSDDTRDKEITFFAIDGLGVNTSMTPAELMNWWMPFHENRDQNVCKAMARSDLSGKQTMPTIWFDHSQVYIIDDILGDQAAEDSRFEDPQFRGADRKSFQGEVMSDGCGVISVGAARKICERLKIPSLPSAFQARINQCKGVWTISAPYDTLDPWHTQDWIQIRKSQLKVRPRAADFSDKCDADRWSFDVVTWSKPLKISFLHRDFMPVLEDRHVPRNTILEMVEERMAISTKEIQDAMHDPAKFVVWRHENSSSSDEVDDPEIGGLPKSASGRTQILLDKAGYRPRENIIAAEAFERMAELQLQKHREKLRFVCPQSTFALGVADPLSVLKAGEIHLSLSQPIVDEETGERFDLFAGKNGLVARHPTLRGSDMQKVRFVSHPELAHLKDVLVMSSTGHIPLAAKLQGGDYDGDEFWVCVNERLVEPFQNAPVLYRFHFDKFEIERETRCLGDIVEEAQFGTDQHVAAFLDIVLPFAHGDNKLPRVTNYWYDLAYTKGDLWDEGVTLIADLHDLIIDSRKNGYIFNEAKFQSILTSNKQLLPTVTKSRAWLKNTEAMNFKFDKGADGKTKLLAVVKQPLGTYTRSARNIIDEVFFNKINPIIRECLDRVYKEVIEAAHTSTRDVDLEHELRQVEAGGLGVDAKSEFDAVLSRVNEAYGMWVEACLPSSSDDFSKRRQVCVDFFKSIKPKEDRPYWRLNCGKHSPTTWEKFVVGVMSRSLIESRQYWSNLRKVAFVKFMCNVALDAICYMKAASASGHDVVRSAAEVKIPKRPKIWRLLDGTGSTQADDDDFGGCSIEDSFDGLGG